jgi:hypothetical protein
MKGRRIKLWGLLGAVAAFGVWFVNRPFGFTAMIAAWVIIILGWLRHRTEVAAPIATAAPREAATPRQRGQAVMRYYVRDTSGEHTNLQLYALKQAVRYWDELQRDIVEHGEGATDWVRERCVFVLAALGLSISQLLGQNNPNPTDKVPYLPELFEDFVRAHHLTEAPIAKFKRFNDLYNGCRHFGLTAGNRGACAS